MNVIVAYDKNRGIGKNNGIPWFCKKDLKYFANVTKNVIVKENQNVVIMGRKTYFSIPEKFRPLKDRVNIVISNTIKELPNAYTSNNLESAIKLAKGLNGIEKVWIIGGGSVYNEIMKIPELLNKLYITKIDGDYDCDTFFPKLTNDWKLINSTPDFENIGGSGSSNTLEFRFNIYERNFS